MKSGSPTGSMSSIATLNCARSLIEAAPTFVRVASSASPATLGTVVSQVRPQLIQPFDMVHGE